MSNFRTQLRLAGSKDINNQMKSVLFVLLLLYHYWSEWCACTALRHCMQNVEPLLRVFCLSLIHLFFSRGLKLGMRPHYNLFWVELNISSWIITSNHYRLGGFAYKWLCRHLCRSFFAHVDGGTPSSVQRQGARYASFLFSLDFCNII